MSWKRISSIVEKLIKLDNEMEDIFEKEKQKHIEENKRKFKEKCDKKREYNKNKKWWQPKDKSLNLGYPYQYADMFVWRKIGENKEYREKKKEFNLLNDKLKEEGFDYEDEKFKKYYFKEKLRRLK